MNKKINHKFLDKEFNNPKWDVNTLILGTFNPQALMSNNKLLVQGFTDIGTVVNGLVPIIYYKQQQFKYLDTDTLEIFDISNVNWISGFHYVGSNLTYLGHN